MLKELNSQRLKKTSYSPLISFACFAEDPIANRLTASPPRNILESKDATSLNDDFQPQMKVLIKLVLTAPISFLS